MEHHSVGAGSTMPAGAVGLNSVSPLGSVMSDTNSSTDDSCSTVALHTMHFVVVGG